MNYFLIGVKSITFVVKKLQLFFTAVELISLFIFCLFFSSQAYAVSCNSTLIQNAIDAATPGQTVEVDGGSCSVSLSMAQGVTLDGKGSTTFSSSTISISGEITNWRITGIKFTNLSSNSIVISDDSWGVFDHCTFNATGAEAVKVYGSNDAWATNSTFGTANAVYFEDCIFNNTGSAEQAVQGNYNSRMVIRFSTINGTKLDAHGIWSNGSPSNYCNWTTYTDAGYKSDAHSARHYEIYGNTINRDYYWGMELRGGTGRIFDNTLEGMNNANYPVMDLHEYCVHDSDGNCCGHTWTASNYPGRDQIGRGKNQTLEPLYIWHNLNQYGSIMPARAENYAAQQVGLINLNRDYYQQLTNNGERPGTAATFTGTSGVGVGTWASRPASCKDGVGYWATDKGGNWNTSNGTLNDGALYICAGGDFTDVTDLAYKPFTYPHPLVAGGVAGGPQPPNNFRFNN